MKCDLCNLNEAAYCFNKRFGQLIWDHRQIDYICTQCLSNIKFVKDPSYWIKI